MKKNKLYLLLAASLILNLILCGALFRQSKIEADDNLADVHASLAYASNCTDNWRFSDDPYDASGAMAAICIHDAYQAACRMETDTWPHQLSEDFRCLEQFLVNSPEAVHPHAQHLTAILIGMGSAGYMAEHEEAAIEEFREFINTLDASAA